MSVKMVLPIVFCVLVAVLTSTPTPVLSPHQVSDSNSFEKSSSNAETLTFDSDGVDAELADSQFLVEFSKIMFEAEAGSIEVLPSDLGLSIEKGEVVVDEFAQKEGLSKLAELSSFAPSYLITKEADRYKFVEVPGRSSEVFVEVFVQGSVADVVFSVENEEVPGLFVSELAAVNILNGDVVELALLSNGSRLRWFDSQELAAYVVLSPVVDSEKVSERNDGELGFSFEVMFNSKAFEEELVNKVSSFSFRPKAPLVVFEKVPEFGVDFEVETLGYSRESFSVEELSSMAMKALSSNVSQIEVQPPSVPYEEDVVRSFVSETDFVELSSFTTEHSCCQNRVSNIHNISRLTTGVVILPGEMFSVNEFIGRRSSENGFVVDGVIENGKLSKAVGGGISQYATTTFNAAYFAGLEFGEYQSHSLYISRYPFGREATLSYPNPDLQIINPFSSPVVLWVENTDTSITVKFFGVEQYEDVYEREQLVSSVGFCKSIVSIRERVLFSGEILVDETKAWYRPGNNQDCQGNAINP